eukprot:3633433-Alexandrium_andersonii.AAC.1
MGGCELMGGVMRCISCGCGAARAGSHGARRLRKLLVDVARRVTWSGLRIGGCGRGEGEWNGDVVDEVSGVEVVGWCMSRRGWRGHSRVVKKYQ